MEKKQSSNQDTIPKKDEKLKNFIEEEKAFENNYDPDEFYPPYDLTEEENNLEPLSIGT